MDLYTFNQKEMSEQAQLVLKRGILLAVRYENNQTITLYHLGSFFAEVGYRPNPNPADIANFFRSHSRINFVQAFNQQDKLAPYLALIKLPEVC
jgi:hypothetical protein